MNTVTALVASCSCFVSVYFCVEQAHLPHSPSRVWSLLVDCRFLIPVPVCITAIHQFMSENAKRPQSLLTPGAIDVSTLEVTHS